MVHVGPYLAGCIAPLDSSYYRPEAFSGTATNKARSNNSKGAYGDGTVPAVNHHPMIRMPGRGIRKANGKK